MISYKQSTHKEQTDLLKNNTQKKIMPLGGVYIKMTEEKTEIKKMPETKIRVGQIVATIWKNDRKEGQDYDTFSVEISKNYTDKDENWKKTSSYNQNELPKVALASQKAYEYLSIKQDKTE